jgi:hypothetical protein
MTGEMPAGLKLGPTGHTCTTTFTDQDMKATALKDGHIVMVIISTGDMPPGATGMVTGILTGAATTTTNELNTTGITTVVSAEIAALLTSRFRITGITGLLTTATTDLTTGARGQITTRMTGTVETPIGEVLHTTVRTTVKMEMPATEWQNFKQGLSNSLYNERGCLKAAFFCTGLLDL